MAVSAGEHAPIFDAATVLLLRDGVAGAEVYMQHRRQGNRFVAQAQVFVGGRVEAADRAEALDPLLLGRDAAARAAVLGVDTARARGFYVAAVRETFEESGILLGVDVAGHGPVGSPRLTALRDQLNEGALAFELVLAELELRLPLDRLHLVAHWLTPPFDVKRFDTVFFAARAPAGQEAHFDARESSAEAWWQIDALLAAHEREELKLAPPTYCVLQDLGGGRSVDELLAAASEDPLPTTTPRLLQSAAGVTLLLPDDHRYADPASAGGREHYLTLEGRHWVRTRRARGASS